VTRLCRQRHLHKVRSISRKRLTQPAYKVSNKKRRCRRDLIVFVFLAGSSSANFDIGVMNKKYSSRAHWFETKMTPRVRIAEPEKSCIFASPLVVYQVGPRRSPLSENFQYRPLNVTIQVCSCANNKLKRQPFNFSPAFLCWLHADNGLDRDIHHKN
jgi:hypothetical protein